MCIQKKVGGVPEGNPREDDQPTTDGIHQRSAVQGSENFRESEERDGNRDGNESASAGVFENGFEFGAGNGDVVEEVISDGVADFSGPIRGRIGCAEPDFERPFARACGFAPDGLCELFVQAGADKRTFSVVENGGRAANVKAKHAAGWW